MHTSNKNQTHKLFVYGSNLHLDDLCGWFKTNGLKSPAIFQCEPAWCPDYEPVYHYYSTSRQGGALDLRPVAGQVTPGALVKVNDETLRGIDRKEGAGSSYARQTVNVLTSDGKQQEAITYLALPHRCEARHIPPTDAYNRLVCLGQQAIGHNPLSMEQAAANQPITPVINCLFVYGTLMQGECREQALEPFTILKRRSGRIPGKLIDLGSYPGLLPAQTASEWVWGECLEFEDIQGALREADRIEGFNGFGHAENYYERRLVQLTLENGVKQMAWVYFYGQKVRGALIANGRWNADRSIRILPDLKSFAPCTEFSIDLFYEQVSNIEHALGRLAEGSVSPEQAATFASNLIQTQRNETEQRLKPGSWCVIPGQDFIPSDARVDFAYMPTYWALAYLCRFQLEYPELAQDMIDLDQTIDRGLEFAVGRKLMGHGYESNQQALNAVQILHLGRLPEWLHQNPSRGRSIKQALTSVMNDFRLMTLRNQNQGWCAVPEDELTSVCGLTY